MAACGLSSMMRSGQIHNHFNIPGSDPAANVRVFASRLGSQGPLAEDPDMDYRTPDGTLPEEVTDYLRKMAERGLWFTRAALDVARRQVADAASLTAVLSIGMTGDVLMHGTTVKFTTGRGVSTGFDVRWFDDLEGFKMEGMAVLSGPGTALEKYVASYPMAVRRDWPC